MIEHCFFPITISRKCALLFGEGRKQLKSTERIFFRKKERKRNAGIKYRQ